MSESTWGIFFPFTKFRLKVETQLKPVTWKRFILKKTVPSWVFWRFSSAEVPGDPLFSSAKDQYWSETATFSQNGYGSKMGYDPQDWSCLIRIICIRHVCIYSVYSSFVNIYIYIHMYLYIYMYIYIYTHITVYIYIYIIFVFQLSNNTFLGG